MIKKKVDSTNVFVLVMILIMLLLMALGVRAQVKVPYLDQSREKLVAIYTRQIGVHEATGHNDGVMVEWYLRTCGLPKGYPWCAAFIRACFLLNGMVLPINGLAASTFNPNNVVYLARRFLQIPKAGDVMVMYYTSLHRIGHTMFFDHKINSRFFESVEGNTNVTGSRDGDGVYRKKRSFHQIYKGSSWFPRKQ